MTERAWTPGDWRVFRTDNAGGPYTEVRIGRNRSEGGAVGEGWRIAGVGHPYNGDADLIALAPEMAEAILAAVDPAINYNSEAFHEAWKAVEAVAAKIHAIGEDNG